MVANGSDPPTTAEAMGRFLAAVAHLLYELDSQSSGSQLHRPGATPNWDRLCQLVEAACDSDLVMPLDPVDAHALRVLLATVEVFLRGLDDGSILGS